MLTPQIKSKLGSNGLNPKWWPRNEILHAFGFRIFVDWRVVRIKKHDPCSLHSAPSCVHSNLKRFNRLSEKGSELKRKILETILQLSICLSCISITFIRTLMKMGAPMKKCLYWQNVQTFASATPHPHWKCALIQLCFDYWLNLSIEIIIIIVTTYSHVSQVRSVRSISCRKKSPRFSFLLKNATDGHSEDGHCLLLSCPSSVIRVTAKKAKLKLSAFLFLVLLIHCFSIPLCLLKACKGLFEVAFSGAAAIQMKPLGAGAHFPEEKRSKNFIWSFQLKVGAVGAVEAKQQLLLVDIFPLAATTNLPRLWNEWQQATVSPFQLFRGSLNS